MQNKENGLMQQINTSSPNISDNTVIRPVSLQTNNQKQAEKNFHESDQLLSDYTENLPLATIECDSDFLVTRWSGEAEKLFGWSSNETLGKPIKELGIISEEEIPVVNRIMEQLINGSSKNVVFTNRNYTKEGKMITCEWFNSILSSTEGKTKSIILRVRDITERNQEKTRLLESERRYRLMFQNLNVGYALHEIIVDDYGKPCDYRFLDVNPAFEIITGLKSSELIGRTITETSSNTGHHWMETFGEIALIGGTVNFENYIDDLKKYFQIHVYSPEPGKFVTIFQDVTELKKAEEEKHLANEIHEQLLKHMTEIRENERAIISREIHDQLGQSLTALKLDLSWLQSNLSTSAEISNKLSGMADIINSTIKDVQRISAELRPGILDDLGLAAAIEWYAEEFEKRSGLHVELDLDEIPIQDEKTSLALFRVMQESLTNVIRHAQATTIKISLHEINEHVVLDVDDNGIGISIEKLKSMKSLGLMSMHDRVKQVNGTLDILCGHDAGTKLRICVPFKY